MSGVILDTGALIALERGDRRVAAVLARARAREDRITIPAGCIAQAWRNGARQARLASLLRQRAVDIVSLDGPAARRVGELLGRSEATDVVDGQVVLTSARLGHTVLTSDSGDLRRLAPAIDVEPF